MLKFGVILFLFALNLNAQILKVDEKEHNTIQFSARATLGDFQGVTHSIDGEIKLQKLTNTNFGTIYFKVYLDSIDTGINLRNIHMREDYLETSRYPAAEFSGSIIKIIPVDYTKSKVLAKGILNIHGVQKEINVDGFIFNYGNLYKLQTEFALLLSDFKINQPTFIINTVEDKIDISVLIYLIKK